MGVAPEQVMHAGRNHGHSTVVAGTITVFLEGMCWISGVVRNARQFIAVAHSRVAGHLDYTGSVDRGERVAYEDSLP